jgi:hypothetical protein
MPLRLKAKRGLVVVLDMISNPVLMVSAKDSLSKQSFLVCNALAVRRSKRWEKRFPVLAPIATCYVSLVYQIRFPNRDIQPLYYNSAYVTHNKKYDLPPESSREIRKPEISRR